jgi:hypothetical protein
MVKRQLVKRHHVTRKRDLRATTADLRGAAPDVKSQGPTSVKDVEVKVIARRLAIVTVLVEAMHQAPVLGKSVVDVKSIPRVVAFGAVHAVSLTAMADPLTWSQAPISGVGYSRPR